MNEAVITSELQRLIKLYSYKYGEQKRSEAYWDAQFNDKTFKYLNEIVLGLCKESYNQGLSDAEEL